MHLEGILFDLDDTLIVDEERTRHAFREAAAVAARSGADVARFAADAVRFAEEAWQASAHHEFCSAIGIAASEWLWGTFPSNPPLAAEACAVRRDVFRRALAAQGVAGDGSEEASEFTRSRSQTHLMPGAVEVLTELRPRFRLGLLTNGDPNLQRLKLETSGLGSFFDEVVVSGEEGIGKPNPGVFHRLLDRMNLPASHAAMVGNSLTRDVAGAQVAGLAAAIWLRVPGAEEFADVVPDATLDALTELPALLEDLAPAT
jgi:putative hydrolase of the HAD superfamily